ncbi:MAG: sigma factor-like helix-turn-helix DNA-binding protein [Bacteroidales bacterium]
MAGRNRVARLDVAGYVPQEEEETDADEMELCSRREDREEWTIRSLAQLPEQDRLMLEMKYFQKCSIQEIQETFHCRPVR